MRKLVLLVVLFIVLLVIILLVILLIVFLIILLIVVLIIHSYHSFPAYSISVFRKDIHFWKEKRDVKTTLFTL